MLPDFSNYFGKYDFITTDRNDGQNYKKNDQVMKLYKKPELGESDKTAKGVKVHLVHLSFL